jgi:biopolymer transport protein ExbD
MKKYLPKIIIGFAGICIGFALCFFSGISPEDRSVIVKIAPNGSVFLSGTQVELSQLSANLKQQGAYRCTIDFHPKDGYPATDRLPKVMDACKAADVSHVSIRTPWSLFR